MQGAGVSKVRGGGLDPGFRGRDIVWVFRAGVSPPPRAVAPIPNS